MMNPRVDAALAPWQMPSKAVLAALIPNGKWRNGLLHGVSGQQGCKALGEPGPPTPNACFLYARKERAVRMESNIF